MDPARFDEARCRHADVMAAIESLEAALRGEQPLVSAVVSYLDFHRERLLPLMRDEESWLGALIAQHLPAEVVTATQLRREHETIDLLASALAEGARRAPRGGDVETDLFAAASDLCLLVRDHIRREDAVLRPLLQRLAEAPRPRTP